jgi:hypothetical protein
MTPSMSDKKAAKPYWEMTTEGLREATKKFDEEFVFERSIPPTPEMKALWGRVKAKLVHTDSGDEEE